MVDICKLRQLVLLKERNPPRCHGAVLHPERIDRMRALEYPCPPPPFRIEHIAKIGIRNTELGTVRPASNGARFIAAVKEIDPAEFKEAVVDSQRLQVLVCRAAIEEFVVLVAILFFGNVVDVLEDETSDNTVGPVTVDDNVHFAAVADKYDRLCLSIGRRDPGNDEIACRVVNVDGSRLVIILSLVQRVDPVRVDSLPGT